MRWKGRKQSSNVIDRRGASPRRGRRTVGSGMTLILILVGLFFGRDVQNLLGLVVENMPASGGQQSSAPAVPSEQQDEAAEFVAVILSETEQTWTKIFANQNARYQAPKLVLYNAMVQSACGVSSAQAGPFYCPGDHQVYIDLSFLNELRRMGAPGDFAFAYVIAHEVGHHVQNLIGVAEKVRAVQSRSSKVKANALSVKMELQADCLAGVWINHTESRQAILEEGDVEEGLAAAAAVGDDRILKNAGRAVHREAFTHGSSAERVYWFKKGMQSGDIQACDTFSS